MTLLTESEVAERLQCSVSKIKRLRLSGQLPYLPGRPVLVDEKDLDQYVTNKWEEKDRREAKRRAATAPLNPVTWARVAVLTQRDRRKP